MDMSSEARCGGHQLPLTSIGMFGTQLPAPIDKSREKANLADLPAAIPPNIDGFRQHMSSSLERG